SRLRRLLARPSPRQISRATPRASTNNVDSRPVGSRRHVGRDPFLSSPESTTPRRTQLLSNGPLAPQPSELRRLQSWSPEMARRHSAGIPPRRTAPLLRPIPENRRAQSRPPTTLHLQRR